MAEDIVERLKSNQPLPICPFDRKSPEYWSTPNDKPCKFCGGMPEGPDKCTGADTRIMGEAAAEIAALRAENERLRTALMPFADAAAAYDGMPPPKYFGDTDFELRYSGSTKTTVTVGQLRDARAAITPQQGEAK